jgi:Raf kinase inhibitor-like YbhB/YbcL family protein
MSLRRLLGISAALTLTMATIHAGLTVSSPAFGNGQPIPAQYAHHAGNAVPDLKWSAVSGAKSYALIVDDPDAPAGLWTHWLVWNIPPSATELHGGALPAGAVVGKNSFGNGEYDGPAPPFGTHRYYFRVVALDTTLTLPAGSSRGALDAAMKGHALAQGETFGTFSKD